MAHWSVTQWIHPNWWCYLFHSQLWKSTTWGKNPELKGSTDHEYFSLSSSTIEPPYPIFQYASPLMWSSSCSLAHLAGFTVELGMWWYIQRRVYTNLTWIDAYPFQGLDNLNSPASYLLDSWNSDFKKFHEKSTNTKASLYCLVWHLGKKTLVWLMEGSTMFSWKLMVLKPNGR